MKFCYIIYVSYIMIKAPILFENISLKLYGVVPLNPFIFEQNSKLIIVKPSLCPPPNQALSNSSGDLGSRRDESGL